MQKSKMRVFGQAIPELWAAKMHHMHMLKLSRGSP